MQISAHKGLLFFSVPSETHVRMITESQSCMFLGTLEEQEETEFILAMFWGLDPNIHILANILSEWPV